MLHWRTVQNKRELIYNEIERIGSQSVHTAANVDNQQLAQFTPGFTPKKVKSGVLLLYARNKQPEEGGGFSPPHPAILLAGEARILMQPPHALPEPSDEIHAVEKQREVLVGILFMAESDRCVFRRELMVELI